MKMKDIEPRDIGSTIARQTPFLISYSQSVRLGEIQVHGDLAYFETRWVPFSSWREDFCIIMQDYCNIFLKFLCMLKIQNTKLLRNVPE